MLSGRKSFGTYFLRFWCDGCRKLPALIHFTKPSHLTIDYQICNESLGWRLQTSYGNSARSFLHCKIQLTQPHISETMTVAALDEVFQVAFSTLTVELFGEDNSPII